MTYDDITLDEAVTSYSDYLPYSTYNNVVRKSLQRSIAYGVSPESARDFVLRALEDALNAYSKTQGNTKWGVRLRRWAAWVSLLNPLKWFGK